MFLLSRSAGLLPDSVNDQLIGWKVSHIFLMQLEMNGLVLFPLYIQCNTIWLPVQKQWAA